MVKDCSYNGAAKRSTVENFIVGLTRRAPGARSPRESRRLSAPIIGPGNELVTRAPQRHRLRKNKNE